MTELFPGLHVEPQKAFLRCRWISGCWSFSLLSAGLATWNYLFWRKVSLNSSLWCFWKQDTCNGSHDISLSYEGYGTALRNFLHTSGSPRTELNKAWLLLWLCSDNRGCVSQQICSQYRIGVRCCRPQEFHSAKTWSWGRKENEMSVLVCEICLYHSAAVRRNSACHRLEVQRDVQWAEEQHTKEPAQTLRLPGILCLEEKAWLSLFFHGKREEWIVRGEVLEQALSSPVNTYSLKHSHEHMSRTVSIPCRYWSPQTSLCLVWGWDCVNPGNSQGRDLSAQEMWKTTLSTSLPDYGVVRGCAGFVPGLLALVLLLCSDSIGVSRNLYMRFPTAVTSSGVGMCSHTGSEEGACAAQITACSESQCSLLLLLPILSTRRISYAVLNISTACNTNPLSLQCTNISVLR